MKKANGLIFTTLFGIAASVGLGQELPITVSKAVLECKDRNYTVAVQFDKSLQSVVDSARFAVRNAPDPIAKEQAVKKLDGLLKNILKLGKKGATPESNKVRELNVLLINGSNEKNDESESRLSHYVVTAESHLATSSLSAFENAIKTGIEPGTKDLLPDILRFRLTDKPDVAAALGLLIESVTKVPQMAPISIDSSCTEPATELPKQTQLSATQIPARRDREKLAQEEDKELANLIVDFSLSNVAKTTENPKPFKASFGLTFVPKHFTKLGAHGMYEFRPIFVDIKYDKAGDTTNILTQVGTRLDHTFVFGDDGRSYSKDRDRRQIIPGLKGSVIGKFDIYKLFKAIDVIGEVQGGIPVNIFQNRTWKLRFEQSGGMSFGKNLEKPEDVSRIAATSIGSTPTSYIARPFHLSELSLDFGQSSFFKIHFNASYLRVYPLTPEARFDNSGNATIGYSTLPRDYGQSKLTFDLGKFVSPFVSYERGRKSPGYVLINNKLDIGFTMKIKGKDR